MRLATEEVSAGDWIVVEEAIDPASTAMVEMHVGEHRLTAYVEGGSVLVRCPAGVEGRARVRVNGERVGTVKVI